MPGSRKPNATVADILEPFPARVRRISEQLRKPDHVRLLFERGAALEDPDGLLEGENVRQVRWIVLPYGAPLPRAAIAALLRRALLYGSTRRRRPP